MEGRIEMRTGSWILLLLCLVVASPLAAQERGVEAPIAGETPAAKLERLQKKLRRISQEALQDRKTQQRRLTELRREQHFQEKTLQAFQKEVDKRQALLDEKKDKKRELEQQIESGNARAAAVSAQILEFYSELQELVEAGIPWQKTQRLDSISKGRMALEGDQKNNPQFGLTNASRLQKEEESLGRLVESSQVLVEVPGKDDPYSVDAFHLGLLAVVFASEDGSIIGYAGQGETLEEGMKIVEDKPEAADGYIKVVEILKRRRTPALIDIYFPKLPVDKGGK